MTSAFNGSFSQLDGQHNERALKHPGGKLRLGIHRGQIVWAHATVGPKQRKCQGTCGGVKILALSLFKNTPPARVIVLAKLLIHLAKEWM
ncbi:hypothetical protein F3J27_14845 [Enterobacter sp. Ap-916]|uniref:hypothetical protein n=1 Tax=unclassified Enterobacter TaxID=2608935 RepID=UPI0014238B40|nr:MULTISPECIES: hypothetical protein [unclassified Enterobacter]NIF59517.1 hypothetical protein [Enterobacter sp. Ap-867]NIG30757.1 hypothetical protein [Enterobacter sp. Ap-916]